jgi:hypothetical protein
MPERLAPGTWDARLWTIAERSRPSGAHRRHPAVPGSSTGTCSAVGGSCSAGADPGPATTTRGRGVRPRYTTAASQDQEPTDRPLTRHHADNVAPWLIDVTLAGHTRGCVNAPEKLTTL